MFFKTLLPSTEQLIETRLNQEDLPRTAVPFIWHFVKIFRVPLGFCALCYTLATAAGGLETYFFGRIVGRFSEHSTANMLHDVALIVLGFILISQVAARCLWQIGHKVEAKIFPMMTMFIRSNVAHYLYGHSYRYFQDDFSGRLAGKVVEMPQAIHDTLMDVLSAFLFTIANALTALVLFSYIHWAFGLIALAYLSFDFLLCRWRLPLMSEKAGKAAGLKQIMRGRYIDSISNILLVKLFVREKFEDKELAQTMVDTTKAEQLEGWQQVLLWRGQHILNGAFQSCVVLISVGLYQAGKLSVADVATLLPLGAIVSTQSWWLVQTMTFFFSRFAMIDDALETITQSYEVKDDPAATVAPKWKGDIVFNNIHFSYNRNNGLFQGLQLHIKAGQKVGLIGPSGSGKSTLVSLLLRFYDVNENEILIDRQNIRKVSMDSLRQNIAVIPQDTALFHRSLMENIRYGRLDASDEDVIEAAKQAFAHDFIMQLPDGYQTEVGERGVKLSGGQRQRIAIARAIIKDAPILILDEATSALDSESESYIQKTLETLVEGKTVLAIAHRLSTIAHMDWLIVMEHGQVMEQGTHAELLAHKGLYAKMWERQSGGFLPEVEAANDLLPKASVSAQPRKIHNIQT